MRPPSYPGRIRQPILIVGAGRDVIVSNTAIENFALHLRAGSHLVVVGAQHELLMEQDRYRRSSGRRSTLSYPARRCFEAVAAQHLHRLCVHAFVAGGDDRDRLMGPAVFPAGDDAAGAFDDRNQAAARRTV